MDSRVGLEVEAPTGARTGIEKEARCGVTATLWGRNFRNGLEVRVKTCGVQFSARPGVEEGSSPP